MYNFLIFFLFFLFSFFFVPSGVPSVVLSFAHRYTTVVPKRKRGAPGKPVRDTWRLLRTLSQGPNFRAAVAADPALHGLFVHAVEMYVKSSTDAEKAGGGGFEGGSRDGLLLAHNVASAISASRGKLPGWPLASRRAIYAWLRGMFPWPPRNQDKEPLPFPTKQHFNPQERTDIDCIFSTASFLLRQGPLLDSGDIANLVGGSGIDAASHQAGFGSDGLVTSPFGWFVEAEVGGHRLLRYLLHFHRRQLANVYLHHVYAARKDISLVFFTALCDQMLPGTQSKVPASVHTTTLCPTRYVRSPKASD